MSETQNHDASVPTEAVVQEAQQSQVSKSETVKPADAEAATSPNKDAASDTEMTDAQAEPLAEEKEAETTAVQSSTVSTAASPSPALPPAESADHEAANKETSSDSKPDVEMADAPTASGDLPSVDQVASTQETTASDIPDATPAEDLSLHAASKSSLAVDATQPSPEPTPTADTSMSDAQQPSVKVARSREDDVDMGPSAKRVKTDPPSDAADASPAPAEAMDVDREVLQQTSLYRPDGTPKTLDDASLDGNIMSRYQSQKIRGVLAGIKKTKAGANFKASVEQLWPNLWADYRLKVPEPTDITTMERRLRGGDPMYPSYANLGDLKKDLKRLHENAVKFNGADHFVAAQGKQVYEQIMERLATISAAEPVVDEKKAAKQHPSRHVEQRPSANPPAAPPPRRPSKPAAPIPVEKAANSPAFAIPPNNNGVPLIRRDSTKTGDNRPKRPIHPPKTKDFGYDVKKKKLSPELRFCNDVLAEIMKSRHFDVNAWFLHPVDTVALNIPTYYNVIKKPMDLETMQNKLSTGQYPNAKAFENDFWQIGRNCRKFNGDTSPVTQKVMELEDLFRSQWAKKDEWMARNAPPERLAHHERPSPRHKMDSDEDDADSEEEVEEKEQSSEVRLVESLQLRLKEEQDKLNAQMASNSPDMSEVDISQTIIATLQKQLITARQKVAEAPPVKKPAKSKAPQPKKPTAPKKKIGSGLDASRNSAAAGRKSGGGVKKAPKRYMGQLEKAVIGQAITEMEGPQQERAIDIIKKDSNQTVSQTLLPLSLSGSFLGVVC
jgi:bromodomain-containing factor 1